MRMHAQKMSAAADEKLMRCESQALFFARGFASDWGAMFLPRHGQRALQRHRIGPGELYIGAAASAPSAWHRTEDFRLRLDRHGLLPRRQLHQLRVLRLGARGPYCGANR